MTIRGGMLQLVLEFLQAIVSKSQKEFYAFVDRPRVANLVCFHRRQIVLLLLCPGAGERRGHQQEGNHKQKMYSQFHGCFSAGGAASGFSAGGAASCFSTGRRGKSIFSSSSSRPSRSCWTICSGGL